MNSDEKFVFDFFVFFTKLVMPSFFICLAYLSQCFFLLQELCNIIFYKVNHSGYFICFHFFLWYIFPEDFHFPSISFYRCILFLCFFCAVKLPLLFPESHCFHSYSYIFAVYILQQYPKKEYVREKYLYSVFSLDFYFA